jgi:hypothetical protein
MSEEKKGLSSNTIEKPSNGSRMLHTGEGGLAYLYVLL